MKHLISLFIALCLLLTGCTVSPSAPQPPAEPELPVPELLANINDDIVVTGSWSRETEVYRYDIEEETYKIFQLGEFAGGLGQNAYIYGERILVIPRNLEWNPSSYPKTKYTDIYANGEVKSRLLVLDANGNITEHLFDTDLVPKGDGPVIAYGDEVFLEVIDTEASRLTTAAFNLKTDECREILTNVRGSLFGVYNDQVVLSTGENQTEMTFYYWNPETDESTELTKLTLSTLGTIFVNGTFYYRAPEQTKGEMRRMPFFAVSLETGETVRLCERSVPDDMITDENYTEARPPFEHPTLVGDKLFYTGYIFDFKKTQAGNGIADLEVMAMFSLNINTGEVERIITYNDASEIVGLPLAETPTKYVIGGYFAYPDILYRDPKILDKASLERGEPVYREFVLAE